MRNGLRKPLRSLTRHLLITGLPRAESRGDNDVVLTTDNRARRIDIQAPRHTFGTHMSIVGVRLQTSQPAMRHSDPTLTANVYTDPKLLDVAGAVASLPGLPQGGLGGHAAAVTLV